MARVGRCPACSQHAPQASKAALAAELQQLRAEHTSLVAAQQAALAQTRREHADAVTALQAQHDKVG